MNRRNVSAVRVVAAILFLGCARQSAATNYYWVNSSGGYFDDGRNWSLTEGGSAAGAVPGAADSVAFPVSSFPAGGSYAVQITNGATTVANSSSHAFAFPSDRQLTLNISPGTLWTLLPAGADSYINFPGALSTLDVTGGGAWMAGKHLCLASSATNHDLTLSVSGAGTVVSNQAWDVWVGKAGYGNRLVVTNGGTVLSSRGVYVGGDAASASNNTVLVSGTHSLLYAAGVENNGSAAAVAIGRDGSGNTLTVTNGGLVYAGGLVNCYSLYLGRNATAVGNTLEVLSGGTFVVSNAVGIGVDGSFSKMRIDGGVMTNQTGTSFGLGANTADSNRIEVVNGGVLSVSGHFRMGVTSNSTDNATLISGLGSQLNVRMYDIAVGAQGHCNTMIVTNGGLAFANRSIFVGGENDTSTGWASSNTLFVAGSGSVASNKGANANDATYVGKRGQRNRIFLEKGATLAAYYLYVGYMSGTFDNAIVASNSTIAARGHLYLGYSANSSNNFVRLVRSTYTSTQYDLDLGYGGPNNWISLEDGSSMTIPRATYIGYSSTASNNVLSIENSTFHGDQYNYCTVGYGGRIRMLGDSNTVFVGQLILTNATSALEFRVDTTNFAPMTVNFKAYLRDATKLIVDARKLQQAGVVGTVSVPLLSAGESLTANLAAMTVETKPAGCAVSVVGKKIVLTKVPAPPGTTVMLQ